MAPDIGPDSGHAPVRGRPIGQVAQADGIRLGDEGVIEGAEGECVTGRHFFEKKVTADLVVGGTRLLLGGGHGVIPVGSLTRLGALMVLDMALPGCGEWTRYQGPG